MFVRGHTCGNTVCVNNILEFFAFLYKVCQQNAFQGDCVHSCAFYSFLFCLKSSRGLQKDGCVVLRWKLMRPMLTCIRHVLYIKVSKGQIELYYSFRGKKHNIAQNYCMISAVDPDLIKILNFIWNIFDVLCIWRSTEIIFLMNNHIYAACYIYNIKLLLSCEKIPKPVKVTRDQVYVESEHISVCTVMSRIVYVAGRVVT
jgi:hypothetical protein